MTFIRENYGIRFLFVFAFIVLHIICAEAEVNRRGGLKNKDFIARKNEYIAMGFIGGWNTKFHLGVMVQLVLVTFSFIILGNKN